MKRDTNRPMVRQGDVLLLPVTLTAIERGCYKKKQAREGGRLVLAHGEATGHHHSIHDRGCSLFIHERRPVSEGDARTMIARLGGGLIPDRLLEVGTNGATLVHQEHDAIKLPAGSYVVRIQREYSPTELRNVSD